MGIWVLTTTITDPSDTDDTGVLGVFGSLERAMRGAASLAPALWDDRCTLEHGMVSDELVRLSITVPDRGEVVWILEQHRLDEHG